MSIDFATADIPAVTVNRTAEPNPFDGKFPSDDKALVVTLTGTKEEQDKQANTLISQARRAAKAVERTARKKTEPVTVKGKPATQITFWTVPPVTRPRTPSDGAGDTAAE